MHIVRIIADRDEARGYVGTRRIRRVFTRGAEVSGSLIGLTGPIIVLEYMQNADLARLHYRLVKHKVLLPNRILWAFFLCRTFLPSPLARRDWTGLNRTWF